MGNSPSRSELNGEHMSNLANNSSGHEETFQSRSYPSKPSSAPLPGIHNEYGSSTLPSKSQQQHLHNNQHQVDPLRQGAVSNGYRTPDPMYSMDSLNVVGNNSSSITSAELPPSSISPANCVTDPWRTSAASFSDESLHTQCRNLSRLHKDCHLNEEDEGLSSSTFEGDSLNTDATLSEMQNLTKFQTFTRNGNREVTPKPEMAEEATELEGYVKGVGATRRSSGQLDTDIYLMQNSAITINGQKVSGCEPEDCSKIGLTAAELNSGGLPYSTNTIKRGRMKSPPPPPPITKVSSSSALPTSPPVSTEVPEKRSLSSSLNSLFRRNYFSSSRKSSAERSSDKGGSSEGQFTLKRKKREKSGSISSTSSSSNEHDGFLLEPSAENYHQLYQNFDKLVKTKQSEEGKEDGKRNTPREGSLAMHLPSHEKTEGGGQNHKKELATTAPLKRFDKGGSGEPRVSEKLLGTSGKDECADSLIRPCELGRENFTNHSSALSATEHNFGSSSTQDAPNQIATVRDVKEDAVQPVKSKEDVCAREKTELDCKDFEFDHANFSVSTNSDQIKFASCSQSTTTTTTTNDGTTNSEDNGNTLSAESNENGNKPNTMKPVEDFEPKANETSTDSGQNGSVTGEEFLSKFGTESRREEGSRESSPVKSTSMPPTSLVVGFAQSDKPGKRSNSSSRRSSTCSSVDFNAMPSSNGILTCNRLSLCSLPDNDGNADNFEEENPVLLQEGAIQDQPLSLKSNGNLSDETVSIEELISRSTKGPEVNGEEDCQKSTPPKVNGVSHQRRLSVSQIDLDCGNGKTSGDDEAAPKTPPEESNQQQAGYSVSFPELIFVDIDSSTLSRNHLAKIDKPAKNILPLHTEPKVAKVNSSPTQVFPAEVEKREGSPGRTKAAAFPNDFLQTLGEIYASKSKLISEKSLETKNSPPQSGSPPIALTPPQPVKTVIEPVKPAVAAITGDGKANKTADSSIDTVEFECQDRSISEYNISPRSAREVMTDTILHCGGSSRSSSSLSQKSNATHQDIDDRSKAPPTPPAPFDSGIEILGSSVGEISSIRIPRVNLNKPGNTGTYKKKPTLIRGKGNNEGSFPNVEIMDPPSPQSPPPHPPLGLPPLTLSKSDDDDRTLKITVRHSPPPPPPLPPSPPVVPSAHVLEEELPKFPTPPPMPPPLHYCQSSSASSSALSSMGDSSEISQNSDKAKPCSKLSSKSSGNGSSECSLVELTAANLKSTSDAIIVELKKAQASKLKSTELQSRVSVNSNVQNNKNNGGGGGGEDLYPPKKGLDESRINQSKLSGSDVSVNSYFSETTSSTAKLVEDPLVQTIVNGKHTNSIIVSDSPIIECVNSDTIKKQNSVNATKNTTAAHLRGNIMSPSLSGNYTEMNGIDSETMGASSIHEDELSGQLQKENHINNEIHGNMEEVQTSNKLDGASFRRVLNEYEKTLSMFIQQIDQLKQRLDEAETEKQTLIKERDQALEDLRNVESAFSDVHRKYERAKVLLENLKTNEDTLVRRDHDMMQRIENRDKKIDMIKEKAQESIEKMHLDYETRIKEMEFENAKLRAQYRKMEMKLSTLENDVEQKAKENAQLSALCDELINGQVGQV